MDKTSKITKNSHRSRNKRKVKDNNNVKKEQALIDLKTFIKDRVADIELKKLSTKSVQSKVTNINKAESSKIPDQGTTKESIRSNKQNRDVNDDDTPTKNSASKRLHSLRKRLSAETVKNDTGSNKRPKVKEEPPDVEPMDCDIIISEINEIRSRPGNYNLTAKPIPTKRISKNDDISYMIVIDTNVMLRHLSIVDEILTDKSNYVVMIPWRVFCELDNLKKCTRVTRDRLKIDTLARNALSYLHKNLPSNDRLIGQTLKDASNHIFPCELPDDEILNCCMQVAKISRNVVLLTNDKNLYLKANVNNIHSHTYDEFVQFLWTGDVKPEPTISPLTIHSKIGDVLKNFFTIVLEEEMKSHYEDLWLNVVYHKPPWSLPDILECITKHWMAVFSGIVAVIAKDSIRDITYYFPRRRKITNLTLEDMDSLKSSSIKLVKYFQMDKKKSYFETARDCIQSLKKILSDKDDEDDERKLETDKKEKIKVNEISKCIESDTSETTEMVLDIGTEVEAIPCSVENQIMDNLTFIWNGFTNFCSQLANTLKISHTFDDKVSTGNVQELTFQANSVGNQISLMIKNISRILTCSSVAETSPEYMKFEANEAAESFHKVLMETVVGMGRTELNFDKVQLFSFCSKYKNVLEDGFNKFMMLHNLILECTNKCSSLVQN